MSRALLVPLDLLIVIMDGNPVLEFDSEVRKSRRSIFIIYCYVHFLYFCVELCPIYKWRFAHERHRSSWSSVEPIQIESTCKLKPIMMTHRPITKLKETNFNFIIDPAGWNKENNQCRNQSIGLQSNVQR